jgi:chemotaxis signal transduction protein
VVDVGGVRTGLRVDRVKQVTRAPRVEMEAPPAELCGGVSGWLEGILKLDCGRRIVMALNAARVCSIGETAGAHSAPCGVPGPQETKGQAACGPRAGRADVEIRTIVAFHIGTEEFAFPIEDVCEILRGQIPQNVPGLSGHVSGVVDFRGRVAPIVDLRQLLGRQSMADELICGCRALRERYASWVGAAEAAASQGSRVQPDASLMEDLRSWLAGAGCSSPSMVDTLAAARTGNEELVRQFRLPESRRESDGRKLVACGRDTVVALLDFERQAARSVPRDRHIVLVCASPGGAEPFYVGLVVDRVREVAKVPEAIVDPAPGMASNGEVKLSGVVKLEDGARLILLLDAASLVKHKEHPGIPVRGAARADFPVHAEAGRDKTELPQKGKRETAPPRQNPIETGIVVFRLDGTDYGIPISRVREVRHPGRITTVPHGNPFLGVANLRGEVVPVLDIRKVFGLRERPPDDRARVVVADVGGVWTGLVVDAVREVLKLREHDIVPPPDAGVPGVDGQFISGVGRVEGGRRLIVLLDMDKIIAPQADGDDAGPQ